MQLFTRPFNPKKFNELAGASAPTGRANAGENSGQQEHFDQSSQLAATWRELIVGLRAPRCSLSGERLDSQQGASYRGTAVVEGADLIMLMRPKSIDESAFRKALQALHTFLNVNPNIPTVRRGQHGEFVVMDNTLVVYPGCNPLLLAKEFVALNAGQQQAVVRIMHAEDYSLMLGLPGTGKTTVLALVVRMLIARGDRVILASFTHSAVDHLLAKLCGAGMTAIHLTRIGASQHVDMKLRSLILDPVQLKTIEQLRIVCKSRSRLFACTALTASRNALLRSLQFDVCVMDEAGQIAQPVALGAVVRARRAVLVGDTFQLPPLVVSKDAQRLGMGESLLKRLCDAHPQAVCALTSQYRMNKDILAVSNALIYENKMTCGSASVANAQLRLPNMQHLSSMSRPSHDWIRRSLQPDISVVLVNTDRIYSERGLLSAADGVAASRANEVEAKLAASIVDALWRCGFDLSEVGILTPFRDQLHCIKQFVFTESKEASTTASVRSGSITSGATSGSTSSKTTCSLADSDISTVDRFQGRDKDVIILSLVRRPPPQRAAVPSTGGEDPAHGAELLHDWRRLNVAITRSAAAPGVLLFACLAHAV